MRIIIGDCVEEMNKLAAESVHLCVTSPPYWGLRKYGSGPRELGQENTFQDYVDNLQQVFSACHRVLRKDGSLYLNLGDSYAGSGKGGHSGNSPHQKQLTNEGSLSVRGVKRGGLAAKQLFGIPWRVAFALQDFGWYLREDIIWAKRNCMPGSMKDRYTSSHEYVFHFTKSARYYYDADAIKEPAIWDVNGTGTAARKARASAQLKSHPEGLRAGIRPAGSKDAHQYEGKHRGHERVHQGFRDKWDSLTKQSQCTGMRNKRDVWFLATSQFKGAHFATFPKKLVEPCILAGCPVGGVVLDPFAGSGTVGEVAADHNRDSILIELNPTYRSLIYERLAKSLV
jgi:DNA modification methylase